MNTIALLIPNGWSVKSYLLTEFFNIISSNSKVIIFTPNANDPTFLKNFKKENVIIEKLNIDTQPKLFEELNYFFMLCHIFRSNRINHINILDSWHQKIYVERGKSLKAFIKFKVFRKVEIYLAKYFLKYISLRFQKLIEKLCYRILYNESVRLKSVFEEHKIDLVFSNQPLISYYDRPAIWASEKLGIKTICILTAWDNLSTKGRIPINYDYYLVWSKWMSDQLIKTHKHIKKNQIEIVGPSVLDIYWQKNLRKTKSDFFKDIELDQNKPVILFCAAPSGQTPNQPEMVTEIYEAIKQSKIINNAQLLVRPHPVGANSYWQNFRKTFPEVPFSLSKIVENHDGIKWKPSTNDIKLLINSILHCDIMINFSSTVTLEAFIFNKPVINIAYDYQKDSFYHHYTRNAYSVESYKPVVENNSTKIAYSLDELINHTNNYLKNPRQNQKNRENLLKLICEYLDGKSSERTANFICKI